MNFPLEQFISEIEKRPPIYDKNSTDFTDKGLKETLWKELYQIFIENLDQLTPRERNRKEQEVKKRWKNLKTCFFREYHAQKNTPYFTATGKKRHKYIHYDLLAFLIPTMTVNKDTNEDCQSENIDNPDAKLKNIDECSSPDGQTDPIMKESTISENSGSDVDLNKPIYSEKSPNKNNTNKLAAKVSKSSTKQKNQNISKRKFIRPDYNIDDLLKTSKDEENQCIDEDKYFLLSLLSSFKRLDQDHKLEVKEEMVKLLQRAKLQQPDTWQTSNVDMDHPYPVETMSNSTSSISVPDYCQYPPFHLLDVSISQGAESTSTSKVLQKNPCFEEQQED